MATKTTTPAQTIGSWLRVNLKGTHGVTLGALTGQDWAALKAAVEIINCFNHSDSENEAHCLTAFRAMVLTMQPQCREFAYHAIAHIGDWNMRGVIWARAACPSLPAPARRCNFERT
jgi:hypothetical protein